MPDVSQMLRVFAKEHGVRLDIVEKDYALSYLLAAIAETPGLGPACRFDPRPHPPADPASPLRDSSAQP